MQGIVMCPGYKTVCVHEVVCVCVKMKTNLQGVETWSVCELRDMEI